MPDGGNSKKHETDQQVKALSVDLNILGEWQVPSLQ